MPKTIERGISDSLISLEKDMDNSMESRRGLEIVFQDIAVRLNTIIDLSYAGDIEIESIFIKKIKDYICHIIKEEIKGRRISEREILMAKRMIREALEHLNIIACE